MNQQVMNNILRIDSSASLDDSVTREIGDEVVRRLVAQQPTASVVNIDLARGMPHIDADWIGANFTPAGQRDQRQLARLAASDDAITALQRADAIVLTAPVYNFSVPSVLKAWIDHVCRAGVTFRYTDKGPQGLLRDRPVYLVMASGGVPFGSAADFASTYLRQVLHFIGIEDVRLVGAERVAVDAGGARKAALGQLDRWLPDLAGQAA
ncbi:MAG TPA: NAD(P)H-dependent oxidoreductase [Gammaproteobacteria bacterium]|nr:NAD(P)H-dependent oxidoreductase [Gammaproteobacteria bacterium]